MSNINLSASGPPETILPPDAAALLDALRGAQAPTETPSPTSWRAIRRSSTAGRRSATSAATHLSHYAYYRIGYHRGLDKLRQNGWRGSGYVRWTHESIGVPPFARWPGAKGRRDWRRPRGLAL
ncbi:MAG: DUF3151 family protein [Acidimicrobiales bacterium]